MTYVGAFRVPQSELPGGEYGFEYAGDWTASGLAFNPANNSLFLNNHVYEQRTAEISIPAAVDSLSLGNLNTAGILQGAVDITEGNLDRLLAGGGQADEALMGGLLVYGNRLIGTGLIPYDAGAEARRSHFTSSSDVSASGDFGGMYTVGDLGAGFYGGYMTQIPPEWQSAFGGPALTGLCCTSIISRTSYGPSAFVFDPDDLGLVTPVPATPVLYYDQDHQTLEPYGASGVHPKFNGSTMIKGIVFPVCSRSVLFFGRTGLGDYCYGTSEECGDPADPYKGEHAYPYSYYVWAYDAYALLDVKNGIRQPWEVEPYATWALDLPFGNNGDTVLGATYDPATQRVYFAASAADGAHPVIHVLQLSVRGGGSAPPPGGPPEPARISREGIGEDLQGDIAVELRVRGAIDLPHASSPMRAVTS